MKTFSFPFPLNSSILIFVHTMSLFFRWFISVYLSHQLCVKDSYKHTQGIIEQHSLKKDNSAGRWWLTHVILTAQEGEIRRITVRSQSWQIVHEILSQKYPTQNSAGRVAQMVECRLASESEINPQYCQK
jgi:hypothetical protein